MAINYFHHILLNMRWINKKNVFSFLFFVMKTVLYVVLSYEFSLYSVIILRSIFWYSNIKKP